MILRWGFMVLHWVRYLYHVPISHMLVLIDSTRLLWEHMGQDMRQSSTNLVYMQHYKHCWYVLICLMWLKPPCSVCFACSSQSRKSLLWSTWSTDVRSESNGLLVVHQKLAGLETLCAGPVRQRCICRFNHQGGTRISMGGTWSMSVWSAYESQ